MQATVGRIVHFYSQTVADRNPHQPGYGYNGVGAGPYPALVTQVFTDTDGTVTYCNLKVFPPFAPPFDEGSVAEYQSQHYHPGRAWVWPPRDGEDQSKPDLTAPNNRHLESPKTA